MEKKWLCPACELLGQACGLKHCLAKESLADISDNSYRLVVCKKQIEIFSRAVTAIENLANGATDGLAENILAVIEGMSEDLTVVALSGKTTDSN